MKSQRTMFKWFVVIMAFVLLFQSTLVLPSVSAQAENTPTPTTTSNPSSNLLRWVGLSAIATGTEPHSNTYSSSVLEGNDLWFHATGGGSCDEGNPVTHLSVGCSTLASAVRVKNISSNTVTLYWQLTTTSSHDESIVSRTGYGGNYGVFPQNVNLTNASYVSQLGPNGEVTVDVAMSSFDYNAPMPSNANFSANVYIRVSASLIETAFTPTPQPNNCSTDTFEPDNSSATGSPITMGEVQRHTLCPQNDQDWVNFQTADLQPDLLVETFDLEPNSINPNGNTQLSVKDSSQNQIGTNQDRGLAPPFGSVQPNVRSSRVAWHPATDGLFNINIFPETPINEQAGTGYSLQLANPFLRIDPVDQASWAPTKVNVPTVWRSGSNVIYFSQMFVFEQAELDALINLNTTLALEFRRPAVNPSTGVEVPNSNVDFGDYFQNVDGKCVGDYWTNLPNHTDEWSEETNLLCPFDQEPLGNEEFEVFIDDPTQLIASKVYYVVVKFYVHSEYLSNAYQFYISKTEHCIKDPQFWELALPPIFCNVVEEGKSSANLIEGHLQPAP